MEILVGPSEHWDFGIGLLGQHLHPLSPCCLDTMTRVSEPERMICKVCSSQFPVDSNINFSFVHTNWFKAENMDHDIHRQALAQISGWLGVDEEFVEVWCE